MTEPVLSIEGLRIELPEAADREFAVDDVDLNVHRGEVLCIVGESGSGKSMSANATMGLLPATVKSTAGRIIFEGRDLLVLSENEMRKLRGRKIGMIFQDPMSALNPLMRVEDQIAEVFEAHGILTPGERRERAKALLGEVGISDPERVTRSYPFQLSGGQRQRVMISMALALEPQILIADEPTTALDVTTQAQILKLIRDLQEKRGMAVIFITHDFGVVAEIAQRVAVMQSGRIVETGTVDEILRDPQHPYTRQLLAAIPQPASEESKKCADRPPILQVENLTKTYPSAAGAFSKRPGVRAVNNVSFSLAESEILGIVGESGSGKSSVGRCIVRLMRPDFGTVTLAGQDMAQLSGRSLHAARKMIQMIFQDPEASLNPRAKVGRIIAEGPLAHGVDREEAYARSAKLLELVRLGASAVDRYPHEFSGGQRQRIGIARALALEPRVIVADEAVSALDVSTQAEVLSLLAELKERLNLSIIFITHDLRVAAKICDRVAVMRRGEIVEVGPSSMIFTRPQTEYSRWLVESIPGREKLQGSWNLSI
ncbi:MAG TPA: ABC transporter ATP-binding protein [Rhizobiaceae bacterium]|nr:ABC transporter ATP-binding protein [Rhizobiaceae bacterium]